LQQATSEKTKNIFAHLIATSGSFIFLGATECSGLSQGHGDVVAWLNRLDPLLSGLQYLTRLLWESRIEADHFSI
jgi:hypothetical protein